MLQMLPSFWDQTATALPFPSNATVALSVSVLATSCAMVVAACQLQSLTVKLTTTAAASCSPAVPRNPVLTVSVYGVSSCRLAPGEMVRRWPDTLAAICWPPVGPVKETVSAASVDASKAAEKFNTGVTSRSTQAIPLEGTLSDKLNTGMVVVQVIATLLTLLAP